MLSDINSEPVIENINKNIMLFVINALEDGWSVKKEGDKYIFKKKHENKKEIFMKSYLEKFIYKNMNQPII
jgi:hypothetical protein